MYVNSGHIETHAVYIFLLMYSIAFFQYSAGNCTSDPSQSTLCISNVKKCRDGQRSPIKIGTPKFGVQHIAYSTVKFIEMKCTTSAVQLNALQCVQINAVPPCSLKHCNFDIFLHCILHFCIYKIQCASPESASTHTITCFFYIRGKYCRWRYF